MSRKSSAVKHDQRAGLATCRPKARLGTSGAAARQSAGEAVAGGSSERRQWVQLLARCTCGRAPA
eukprot:11383492-Alexandrium_andersonii.AAC.1